MVGYSCDRFVDPLFDDLMCPICLQVFDNAVITACGHTYCYDCLKQWLTPQRRECPDCRQPMATRRRSRGDVNDNNVILIGSDVVVNNRSVNSMVSKLRIRCDFESDGCPEVMALESMATHVKTCGYKVCQTCGLADISTDGNHNCIELLKDKYKSVELENKSIKLQLNELNEEMDPKLNSMPIVLIGNKLWFENKEFEINLIEINDIGIKVIKTIRDNDQKDVENNIIIPFIQMVKLEFYSSARYRYIEISIKSDKLNQLVEFMNRLKVNINSNEIHNISIHLKESFSEWLAKQVINKCKQVNSDCKSSYGINA